MASRRTNNIALSSEIEDDKIRGLQRRIDSNSEVIDGIVNRLVAKYCRDLDEYVENIRIKIQDLESPPTLQELEHFTLNLPTLLYFSGEALEALGVKEDMAKAVKMEVYNQIFESAQKTVKDKTAAAELGSQTEYLTHTAYQRAYKKIKFRIDAATELLQSVKKVLSSRMVEMELARMGR